MTSKEKEDRTRRNHIPKDISEIYELRKDSRGNVRIYGNAKNGWIKMTRIASVYHRKQEDPQGKEAKYNRKFIKPDKYGGASEAVICFPPGKEPYLVEEGPNCGTYNYSSPYRKDVSKLSVKGIVGHVRQDLVPYIRDKRKSK